LDDHGGRIARDLRVDGGAVAARDEAHVEGRAREAVPLFPCAPGHRAAAAVRPWKPPSMAATCARPVMRSATLSAFSLASAPLLTRNALANGSREKRTRRRAACARIRIATALLWN